MWDVCCWSVCEGVEGGYEGVEGRCRGCRGRV